MPTLSPLPPFPSFGDPDYAAKAAAYLQALADQFVAEMNAIVVQGGTTHSAVATLSDQTANRLLLTGYHGLGGNALLIGNAGVVDGSLGTGFHHYSTAGGSSGGPTGATLGTLQHTRSPSGEGETQIFVVEAGTGDATAGSMWVRSRTAGAWSAWATFLSTAAFTSGSNANGTFRRLHGGLQICTFVQPVTSSTGMTWTFPAAFSAAPVVSALADGTAGGNDKFLALNAAPSTTSVTYTAYVGSGTATTGADAYLTAIGAY